jgi:deazaflavin-dependent oxidoreductase (nitroreductase family)
MDASIAQIGPADRTCAALDEQRSGRLLDLMGLPSIQLTVRGRKSGTPRSVTVQYIPDGETLLVVGSNWAGSSHPDWWSANLIAAKEATIRSGTQSQTVTVELLTGAECDHAWAKIVASWPNYVLAQQRAAGRSLRLFVLRPTG